MSEETVEAAGDAENAESMEKAEKKIKVRRILTIAFLILVFFFLAYSAKATPVVKDKDYTYIGNLKWYNDYETGLKVAQEQNKPIFMYFWAIWCTFCEDLHKYVYSDPEVSEILKNEFVLVAVDMDVNKKDTQKFNVAAPPHEIFLTKDGEIITRVPGYIPRDDFLSITRSVLDFVKSKQTTNAGASSNPHG